MPSTPTDPRFPAQVLREYALLADGERGVLVGPRGDFSWMCVPRWDSDTVFTSLLGGGGTYAITPSEQFVWGGYYENDASLIWVSRWVTTSGIIECREALAFPGDPHRAVVLRQVHARQGRAALDVLLDVRRDFGHTPVSSYRKHDGVWTAEVGGLQMRWTGGPDARERTRDGARQLTLHLEVDEGDCRDFVLELADWTLPDRPPDPRAAWGDTEVLWQKHVPPLEATVNQRDARHSYAVLRGLTSSGGGMVAAATTSLPERASKGRNYDYRYVWIRDQCYAGQAAAAGQAWPLLDDAVRFVADRLLADGPRLVPAYTTLGEPVPDQRTIDVPGYPGGGHVIGNHARHDFQLDTFGECLLLFARAAENDRLDADGWHAVEAAVATIAERWQEPDAGIWEIESRRWTHSRLICAAGLNAICSTNPGSGKVRDWLALADKILAHEAATSVHPTGRWQRADNDDRVDASLLLSAIRGAVPSRDPRSVQTVEAVKAELAQDGYVYRFREAGGPLGQAEGAFLLCGFLMALATHQLGDSTESIRWFERNIGACGPPGLYSEEYDVRQRQLRGNLPQAFVHALALESSARLAAPWGQATGLH